MVGAARWGLLVVAVAVACMCGVLAPAASASLSVPTGGSPVPFTGSGTSGTSAAIASFEAAAGGGDNGTIAGEQRWRIPSRHVGPDRARRERSGLDHDRLRARDRCPRATGCSRRGSSSGRRSRWPTTASSSVGSNTHVHAIQHARTSGAPFNSTRHGRVRRGRAGRPGEHADGRRRPGGSGSSSWMPAHPPRSSTSTGRSRSARSRPTGTTTTWFGGLLFPDPVVTRVVVTLGGGEIFGWNGTHR